MLNSRRHDLTSNERYVDQRRLLICDVTWHRRHMINWSSDIQKDSSNEVSGKRKYYSLHFFFQFLLLLDTFNL